MVHEPFKWTKPVWVFLEDPSSSYFAASYNGFLALITSVNITLVCLATVDSLNIYLVDPNHKYDNAIYAIFTLDFILRMLFAPSLGLRLLNFYNWIDFVSLISFYVELGVTWVEGEFMQLFSLIRPALRLMSLSRHYFGFKIMIGSLRVSAESLPIPMFMLLLMVISGSIFLYYFEHQANPSLDSIPQAMYLTIVTIATVGYGDVYPITVGGKITACILILSGVMYMAMPLAIVGSNFVQAWNDRDRTLLAHRVSDQLVQFGFSATDLLHAFKSFDLDKDGRVTIDEFTLLVRSLKLGIEGDRIVDLFLSFDRDADGTLNLTEFARAVFPHHVWTAADIHAKEAELSQ